MSNSVQKLSVALLPIDFIGHSEIIFLPHPRNGIQSPFVLFQDRIFEMLEVSFCCGKNQPNQETKFVNCKSFFVGNSVVSNGNILTISEMHPIMMILPLLIKRKGFFSYEKYFIDTPYEIISRYVYRFFDDFGEYGELNGEKFWCFKDSKMLSFLEKKFERLCDYCKTYINENYIDKIEKIHEKSFDIFRHYLPPKYADHFKSFLAQKHPQSFPKNIFGSLLFVSKMVDNDNNNKSKKDKKIPKFSYRKKKIPKYLQNNREITSFFKPQKILA